MSADFKTCIYDNPRTYRREHWMGGKLQCCIAANAIAQSGTPATRATPRQFEPGRLIGDAEAIAVDQRPQESAP